MIVKGGAWNIEIDLPPEAKEAMIIFARHEWSGKVQLRWGNQYSYEDLYSWYGLSQPVRVFRGGASNKVTVTGSGKNEASRGSECVICGFYWR